MTTKITELLQEAILEGKKSKPEDAKPHPRVGAVVFKGQKILAKAHRGELAKGDHAEYTLLERKLSGQDLTGCTLISTLEPCTQRNHPKVACTSRLIGRRISKVYVGIADPNPDVYGKGILKLQQNEIQVQMFPKKLADEIRKDNKTFIELHGGAESIDPRRRKLDDWYYTINSIYFRSNFYRDAASIFAHLVEIMGGLSALTTGKKKPEVSLEGHMAKAVAWWLALCAKVGLRSVEELIWYKFPFVCPYCQRFPHDEDVCTEAKLKNRNPDWRKLNVMGQQSLSMRPNSLGAWQQMFAEIYQGAQTEDFYLVFGRSVEELGELAEAIRVGPVVPGYYLSEAADVFAWLMKLVNTYEAKLGVPRQKRGELLEKVMYEKYPDKCTSCSQPICTCPPILPTTLGRIAHDGPDPGLLVQAHPFMSPTEAAAFFEIGSVQIVVGAQRLAVNPELATEVKYLVQHLAPKLREPLALNPDALHHLGVVLNRMEHLADQGRVSDRHIQNLLRMLALLNEGELTECQRLFATLSRGTLVSSLMGCVEHLRKNFSGDTRDFFGET